MNKQEILTHVDHTLLKQTASWEEIRVLCDDAMHFHTASVCIPPCYVKQAADYVEGNMKICTVIGFPNGNHTTAAKVFETEDALRNGASEVDMVINIGALKAGKIDMVEDEIRQIRDAAGQAVLKVIIETCFLTDQEKIEMCRIVTESGADYIKTSTGFGGGGAVFSDIALFALHVGTGVKIKAAGGISTFEDAEHFLSLGADRLGTSRLVQLMKA